MKNPHAKSAIGVVIPAFGHPQFLVEAIVSACEQDIDRPYHVVVVDDGCKFFETGRVAEQLLETYAGKLHYLRQKNTRLPGARNSGIRFLLALDPDLDSIYFLDADNRLAPYSLAAFRAALGDDKAIGWAYPDISMFGLSRSDAGFDTRETAPDYSQLKHLIGNISEAGSLVRADVFRSGVFFNENMTSGFEDWDFWLAALSAGYVGCRARHSGFLYRRRPESMLSDARRVEDILIARMRETYKPLYTASHILALEQQEAPAFAILLEGSDTVLLTSDPKMEPRRVSLSDFVKSMQTWLHQPREYFFPDALIFTSEAEWARLQASTGLLRWCFWRLREQAQPFVGVSLKQASQFNIRRRVQGLRNFTQPNSLFSLKTNILRTLLLASDPKTAEASIAGRLSGLPKPVQLQISAPEVAPSTAAIAPSKAQLNDVVAFIQAAVPTKQTSKHQTRKYSGPTTQNVRQDLIREICAEEEREPFPANNGAARAVVFINAAQFQNADTTKQFSLLLSQLEKRGLERLVILEISPGHSMKGADLSWWSLATDIVPLPLSDSSVAYRLYLGRRVAQEMGLFIKESVSILARTGDVLICCGTAAGIEAFGQAKPAGAPGYVLLDPAFAPTDLHQSGYGSKLLAYEHAVSSVVTEDGAYIDSMCAAGFPSGKFQSADDFWQNWSV